MKNLVIFGNNDFARLIKYYIDNDDERNVVAFTVNQDYINQKEFCGLPVVPFEKIENYYSTKDIEILVAIGNKQMNNIRKKVFNDIKIKGYDIASYIHSSCKVHSKNIGYGNIFLEDCLIYPFAKIGNGNLLWDHVLISHDCEVGDFNTFSSYADLCGYVTISHNCYFGKHCVLQEYSEINEYTLVGANALVKRQTKPYDVIVPAKSVTLDEKKSTDFM